VILTPRILLLNYPARLLVYQEQGDRRNNQVAHGNQKQPMKMFVSFGVREGFDLDLGLRYCSECRQLPVSKTTTSC
jgi:hypothetical protein